MREADGKPLQIEGVASLFMRDLEEENKDHYHYIWKLYIDFTQRSKEDVNVRSKISLLSKKGSEFKETLCEYF